MTQHLTQTIEQNLTTLAGNLDRHMRIRGMTEDGLAQASGISPRTVGNFLRPNNRTSSGTSKSFPSGTLASLVRLAAALDLEAWELLINRDSASRSRERDAARSRFIEAVEHAYMDRLRAEAAAAALKPRSSRARR